jgi:hypothetical protein
LEDYDIEQFTKDCRPFLSDYSDFTEKYNEVRKLPDQLLELRKQHIEDVALESMEKGIRNNPTPWLCYSLASNFLGKYPQGRHASTVRKRQQECLMKADEQAWNEIKLYSTQNRTEHVEIIKKAQGYLNHPTFTKHLRDAKQLIQETTLNHDRYLYEEILTWFNRLENKITNSDVIYSIKRACEKYRNEAPLGRMLDKVEDWLKWHKTLEHGIEFYITVQSIYIDRNTSSCYARFSDIKSSVTIKIGDKEYKTGVLKVGKYNKWVDFTSDHNYLLGPFTWQLGKTKIEVTHTCWSKKEISVGCSSNNPSDDAANLRLLYGECKFDNDKISVKLLAPVDPQAPVHLINPNPFAPPQFTPYRP